MAINDFNLISLNYDSILPQFSGIVYKPTIESENEEFIEIEEKHETNNSTQIFEYQSNISQSFQKDVISNNPKKEEKSITNIQIIPIGTPSMVIEKDKKNLEDLFDLLDNKPKYIDESFKNENIIINQGFTYNSKNQNDNISQKSATIIENDRNTPQNLIFNSFNQQATTILEDDEFVEIEENSQNITETNTNINHIDFISAFDKNTKASIENIDAIYLNKFDFTLNKNDAINNDIDVQEEKQIDFQKLLFDTNFNPQKKKVENESVKENRKITPEVIFKQEELIKTNETSNNKNIATLDDLLNIVEVDWNTNDLKSSVPEKKEQIQENFLGFSFNTQVEKNPREFNENQTTKESNSMKPNLDLFNLQFNRESLQKQEEDHDEFREVEENYEDHKREEIYNNHNDNLLLQMDFLNQNDKIHQNAATNSIELIITPKNTEDKSNLIDQHNKVSIMNYTQDDFLNEFRKEQIEIKKDINSNEDFEFTSVEENDEINHEEKSRQHLENLSTIEFIFKHKIKNFSFIERFKSNCCKVVQVLIEMISNIEKSAKEILEFVHTKKFNKLNFENDRKLENFFKTIQQILVIGSKLLSILRENNYESKQSLENKLNNLILIIKNFQNVKNEIFDFKKFFDDSIIHKFCKLSEVMYKVDKDKIYEKKICHLCLYDNESLNENITNLFSYDFHTSCINLWINKINNKSPYDE